MYCAGLAPAYERRKGELNVFPWTHLFPPINQTHTSDKKPTGWDNHTAPVR